MSRKNSPITNAIGIDLGTTYSCVGVYQNGRVEIISNDQGNRTTPSYVAFDGTERLIGDAAKAQSTNNHTNTVFDAKRMIGRNFSDQKLQEDLKHFPFNVVCGKNDKPMIQVEYMNETKLFSPEEISSMVLSKMKTIAEAFLGSPVTHAVVTVPAYFNDAQRQATIDAGTIAGLTVMRIINEPTAAAIAYGLEKEGNRNVLIYDFGGGTLDVSILEIEDGVFEVKSTSGDVHLGGEDFDNRLVQHCLTEFCKKNKLSDSATRELLENKKSKRRLRTECEKAKKILSSTNTVNINVDALYNGFDLNINLTRSKFEDLCADIFQKCMAPIDDALKGAKMGKAEITDVVLVGGSTRIPKIQNYLEDFFQKKPKSDVNPDEAVAFGAAVQAHLLSGQPIDEKLSQMVLLDVIPLTLGVETSGGIMTPIINRNTTKPCKKEETFSTYSDNQPAVTIKVYEGERKMAKDNNLLGTFDLTGIPPMPRGVPRIKIVYDVDTNGILNVSASEESTGSSKKITITNENGRMSKEEIERKVADAEKYADEDNKNAERITAKNNFEQTLYSAKNQAENSELKDKLTDDQKKQINDVFTEYSQWLDENSEIATTTDFQEKEKEAQNKLMPVFAAVYQNSQPESQPQGESKKMSDDLD
jgi:L1 cell adhesion molecule like protein